MRLRSSLHPKSPIFLLTKKQATSPPPLLFGLQLLFPPPFLMSWLQTLLPRWQQQPTACPLPPKCRKKAASLLQAAGRAGKARARLFSLQNGGPLFSFYSLFFCSLFAAIVSNEKNVGVSHALCWCPRSPAVFPVLLSSNDRGKQGLKTGTDGFQD